MNDSFILGIDIGGTFIKTGIYSLKQKKLFEIKIWQTINELDEFLKLLKKIFLYYKKNFKFKKAGIGFPGNISQEGEILFSPHLRSTVGFNLKKFLIDELEILIKMENDANLFALAHSIFSVKKYKDLIGITLGTGIGGGVVLNGKLLNSSKGLGFELGHITVVPNGELCSCGKKGCIEAYSSSSGMINRYGNKKLKEFKNLYEIYKKGDLKAEKIIKEGFYYLGIGTGSLINIFSPEIVFFGGGISNIFYEFYEFFLKGVKASSLNFLMNFTTFKKSFLNNAGILGAVGLWISN